MKGDNSHSWQSSGWLRRGCRCPAEVTRASPFNRLRTEAADKREYWKTAKHTNMLQKKHENMQTQEKKTSKPTNDC